MLVLGSDQSPITVLVIAYQFGTLDAIASFSPGTSTKVMSTIANRTAHILKTKSGLLSRTCSSLRYKIKLPSPQTRPAPDATTLEANSEDGDIFGRPTATLLDDLWLLPPKTSCSKLVDYVARTVGIIPYRFLVSNLIYLLL